MIPPIPYTGKYKVINLSASRFLTNNEVGNSVVVMTGSNTMATLPKAVTSLIGKTITFYIHDSTAKHIDCNDADKIFLRGSQLPLGNKVSIGINFSGKLITFMCIDTTGWITFNAPAEFTDGGA